MADPTREEFNAKIEAVEARLETRLVEINGKLDRLADQLSNVSSAANRAETAAEGAKTAAGATRWNILFTGIAVATVILAVWGIWAQGIEMVSGIMNSVTGGQ